MIQHLTFISIEYRTCNIMMEFFYIIHFYFVVSKFIITLAYIIKSSIKTNEKFVSNAKKNVFLKPIYHKRTFINIELYFGRWIFILLFKKEKVEKSGTDDTFDDDDDDAMIIYFFLVVCLGIVKPISYRTLVAGRYLFYLSFMEQTNYLYRCTEIYVNFLELCQKNEQFINESKKTKCTHTHMHRQTLTAECLWTQFAC